MKTLITGGAGFIGSHLAEALIVSGHDVVLLDSMVEQVHGPRPAKPAHTDAEFIHGDVRSVETVAHALAGVDNVVHMAAETAVGQSMYEIARSVDVNDHGTAAVLQAIVERPAQVRRLVLFSSRAVYGEGLYTCSRCGEVNPSTTARSAP